MLTDQDKYPDINSIKQKCKKTIPSFIWHYFDGSTGKELYRTRNRKILDSVLFSSDVLKGNINPKLNTNFMAFQFNLPFGVAPVGMSSLIQKNAEKNLANLASTHNFPYVLSTVGSCSIEEITKGIKNMHNIWFQLYCPKDEDILIDLLDRCDKSGIETLVVTLDLPFPSVRERQISSGLTIPISISWKILLDIFRNPIWLLRNFPMKTLQMKNLTKYQDQKIKLSSTKHIGYRMRQNPDMEYLKKIRSLWKGKIILKGVSSPEHLEKLKSFEYDAIWLSNHSGRQFDGSLPVISFLKSIRKKSTKPIIIDGGLDSGLDIIRAFALGADFVMMGRAWHYSFGAFGKKGPLILLNIIKRDIISNMAQLGIEIVENLKKLKIYYV